MSFYKQENLINNFIKPAGIGNIILGQSIDSIQSDIIPFDSSDLKDSFRVTPSVQFWYIYDVKDSSFAKLEGIKILAMFILTSDERLIKRIKIYVNDPGRKIYEYCQQNFNHTISAASTINENEFNQHNVWNTSEGVTFYLLNPDMLISQHFGCNTELTIAFLKDAGKFGKFIVRPGFDTTLIRFNK